MKKIGITGYRGRLGKYLLGNFPNYQALDCDVTNPNSIENCFRDVDVDSILHLAAKSDVEWCEKPDNEKIVTEVNLRGTFNVCRAAGHKEVILLSSDHVFSGTWGRYKEKDKPSPTNFYGFSKYSAEGLSAVFDNLRIIRTSYLFDSDRISTQINNLRNNIPEIFPTFIIRSFMFLPHFSNSLNYYFEHLKEMPKVLHIGGSKSASWYEFIRDLAKFYGIKDYNKIVLPRKIQSLNYAPRPFYGGLNVSLSKRLHIPQYSYLDGFKEMK